MYFSSWENIFDAVVIGILAYIFIVLFLRISGKRTLSKWNSFDFIVTIAFGSMLASIILSKSISLADGTIAIGLLVLLQFIVTWLSVRSKFFRRAVKAEPRLLFYKGEFRFDDMKNERVTESEILAAVRGNGISRLESVGAVILETDGSFSVIENLEEGASALADVTG